MKNIVAELTRRALSAVSNPATAAVPAYPLYRGLSDYVSEVEQPVTERLSERLQHLPSRYGYPINISPGAAKFTAENVLAPSALVGMFVGPRAKGWEGLEGKFSARFDKMPRAEISDEGVRLIPEGFNAMSLRDFEVPVSEVLEHPQLYKMYPEIGEYKVKKLNNDMSKGSYSGKNISLNTYGSFSTSRDVEDTLLHEIQHAIQEKEGWARGGSPEQFGQERGDALARVNFLNGELSMIAKKLDGNLPEKERGVLQKQYDDAMSEKMRLAPSITSTPAERYGRLAGEIEARDTAARKDLTLKERMSKMPYESQGIPLEDMIVKTRGDGSRKRALFRAIQNK